MGYGKNQFMSQKKLRPYKSITSTIPAEERSHLVIIPTSEARKNVPEVIQKRMKGLIDHHIRTAQIRSRSLR
jgi:hypothetical protein